jgi:adenine/guanine phosphoribosyltransferase-like PRPP-binding protein
MNGLKIILGTVVALEFGKHIPFIYSRNENHTHSYSKKEN